MATTETLVMDEARFVGALGQAIGGDWSAWADLWAEDAVWHAAGRNPYSGDFHGREAIVGWFRGLMETGATPEPLEILTDGEHFVFFIRIRMELPDGRVLVQEHADAWRVRDGRFVEGYFLPDDQHLFDEFMTAHHAAHSS
jgi:uncharacterized protein